MTDLELQAFDVLVADDRGVSRQHRFVCHGDESACGDGCDRAPDRERLAALRVAADLIFDMTVDHHTNARLGRAKER